MAPSVLGAVGGLLVGLVGRHIGTSGEVLEVVIFLAFPISTVNFHVKLQSSVRDLKWGKLRRLSLIYLGNALYAT